MLSSILHIQNDGVLKMKRFLSVFLVVVIIAIQMISFCGCDNETQLNKYKAYYFDYFDTATTIIGYANTPE